MKSRFAASILLIALIFLAQSYGQGFPLRPESIGPMLEQQLDTAALRPVLQGLLSSFKGEESIKAEASQLAESATAADAAGDHAAVRERLLHAIALLRGKAWTERDRFSASLSLTSSKLVADDATSLLVSVGQTYPSAYTPAAGLVVHLLLAQQGRPGPPVEMPGAGSPPSGPRPAMEWHDLGKFDLRSDNLIHKPVESAAKLAGYSGDYMLAAELYDGDARIARMTVQLSIVHNFVARQIATEKGLAKVKGSEVTRQSIEYPFDLARMINSHSRKFIRYNFDAGIKRSEELLAELGKSQDSLWRAKGRTQQAYAFTAAGEISPFGVYVPMSWDGHSNLKVLLILHGINEDQDSMLDRDGGIIPAAAEKHGYLVITPNGYRTDGWYGATNKPGQPGGTDQPGGTYTAAELKYRNLSEQDVLNVLATVEKEYPVDLSHVYLMGQSMGGAGAWYLAQKFPEKWAALVATAAAGIEQPYPYDRLRGMPILCGVGTKDGLLPYTRDQAAALNARGIPAEYHEVKDANHHSIVAEMLPDIFDFLDTHMKSPPK